MKLLKNVQGKREDSRLKKKLQDKCGELPPFEFLNRIFSVCNYTFRSEFTEE